MRKKIGGTRDLYRALQGSAGLKTTPLPTKKKEDRFLSVHSESTTGQDGGNHWHFPPSGELWWKLKIDGNDAIDQREGNPFPWGHFGNLCDDIEHRIERGERGLEFFLPLFKKELSALLNYCKDHGHFKQTDAHFAEYMQRISAIAQTLEASAAAPKGKKSAVAAPAPVPAPGKKKHHPGAASGAGGGGGAAAAPALSPAAQGKHAVKLKKGPTTAAAAAGAGGGAAHEADAARDEEDDICSLIPLSDRELKEFREKGTYSPSERVVLAGLDRNKKKKPSDFSKKEWCARIVDQCTDFERGRCRSEGRAAAGGKKTMKRRRTLSRRRKALVQKNIHFQNLR